MPATAVNTRPNRAGMTESSSGTSRIACHGAWTRVSCPFTTRCVPSENTPASSPSTASARTAGRWRSRATVNTSRASNGQPKKVFCSGTPVDTRPAAARCPASDSRLKLTYEARSSPYVSIRPWARPW